jgi:hypothetical protein
MNFGVSRDLSSRAQREAFVSYFPPHSATAGQIRNLIWTPGGSRADVELLIINFNQIEIEKAVTPKMQSIICVVCKT